jgi:hypothetical protein
MFWGIDSYACSNNSYAYSMKGVISVVDRISNEAKDRKDYRYKPHHSINRTLS